MKLFAPQVNGTAFLRTALLLGVFLALVAEPAYAQDEYEGDGPGECTDRADNDRDGKFDCDDEGCAGSPDCDDDATGKGPAPLAGDDHNAESGGPPQDDLKSEEGYAFSNQHELTDYNQRRVGLATTADQKTVSWGVGGASVLGIAAGVSSSVSSTERRLLMVDGAGAVYDTVFDFFDRIGSAEWLLQYEEAIELEMEARSGPERRRLHRDAVGFAVTSFSIGLAGAAVIAGVGCLGPDRSGCNPSGGVPAYGLGAIATGGGFALALSIPHSASVPSTPKRLRKKFDFDLGWATILEHLDRHNRLLALQLGADAGSVGDVPEEPDPSALVVAAIRRTELRARTETLGK